MVGSDRWLVKHQVLISRQKIVVAASGSGRNAKNRTPRFVLEVVLMGEKCSAGSVSV